MMFDVGLNQKNMCRIVVCNFVCGSGEYDVCRLEQLHLGIVGKDSLQKKVDFVMYIYIYIYPMNLSMNKSR